MKQINFLSLVEWAVRINVFVKLSTYGLGKILNGQFYRKGVIPEEIGNIPLAEVGSYDLAWTFFGHSKPYILFIGISQLLGALLFLIPRFKLIGGAILIPILLNIIVVDYFFGVAYGALFSACFYLASILWVLYLERERITSALRKLIVNRNDVIKTNRLMKIAIVAGLFVILFFVEYLGISTFGYEDRV